MKVILTEYVYMHGVAGDIVDVANGFARNYLLPQKKAVRATPRALAEHEALLEQAAIKRQELTDRLVAVSNKIDGTELVFGRKAGRNNQLYGSVTTRDIAEALLEETGIDIDRRRVSERPLRELGRFDVPIRMGQDLSPNVKVVILPEDEVEDYMENREAYIAELEAEEAARAEAEALAAEQAEALAEAAEAEEAVEDASEETPVE